GSRRAELGRWWTASTFAWSGGLGKTSLPSALGPFGPVACDGTDVWVGALDSVFRIRASDGKLLETWSIKKPAGALLVAMGRVFVAGFGLLGEPGILSLIDPRQSPGAAAVVATDLPTYPFVPAFDGARIWTANTAGSVSTISPTATTPWPVATVASGFQVPSGIVFDGQHVWVSDSGNCMLLKLDPSSAILQTVSVGLRGGGPLPMTFDGSHLLVANALEGLNIVRVADGASVALLDVAYGAPSGAAFDGERILVIGQGDPSSAIPPTLSLLRASDFSPLGVDAIPGIYPMAAASDGLDFWITVETEDGSALVRL
ncbi:MAG: hypothetical protein WAU32_04825, partial [Thermoanaerobaculia bacterium]